MGGEGGVGLRVGLGGIEICIVLLLLLYCALRTLLCWISSVLGFWSFVYVL